MRFLVLDDTCRASIVRCFIRRLLWPERNSEQSGYSNRSPHVPVWQRMRDIWRGRIDTSETSNYKLFNSRRTFDISDMAIPTAEHFGRGFVQSMMDVTMRIT